MKLHKNFSFDEPRKSLNWGTLHAKLRGMSKNVHNNLSVTGSPYELLIWFSSGSEVVKECSIKIEKVAILPLDGNDVQFSVDVSKADFRKKHDGTYIASFIFKGLDIEYRDYKLDLSYQGLNNCQSIVEMNYVELIFHKDYTERKISFWDSLMGV